MKLAIVGSRTFDDYDRMVSVINSQIDLASVSAIVSGGARGADSLAWRLAQDIGILLERHDPDWQTHGRAAGHIRNTAIVDAADAVIAFWDGESRGTQDSIKKSRAQNKLVFVDIYT